MTKISSIGKFLDQPILTAKLNKHMPEILTIGSGIFLAKQLHETPENERLKHGIKSAIILGATGFSANHRGKRGPLRLHRAFHRTARRTI